MFSFRTECGCPYLLYHKDTMDVRTCTPAALHHILGWSPQGERCEPWHCSGISEVQVYVDNKSDEVDRQRRADSQITD